MTEKPSADERAKIRRELNAPPHAATWPAASICQSYLFRLEEEVFRLRSAEQAAREPLEQRVAELVGLVQNWIAGHPCDCECSDCRKLSDWLMEHGAIDAAKGEG